MKIQVKKEHIIFISFITVFLAQLGISMYLPALPLIVDTLSSQQQDIALSFPAFLIGMAALMLIWGSLSEKYGRKTVILIAILFYSLCSFCIPMVSNAEMFIFLRFLQGAGAGGMTVLSRVLIKDNFSGDQLTKSLAWLSISFVISVGIGQFLGAAVTKFLGWQAIFFSLAIATLVLSLFFSYITLPNVQSAPSSLSSKLNYVKVVRCRRFLLPALAGGLGYGVVVTFNTNAPFIFQTALQWSAYEYGLLGWPITIAYFLGALIVGRYVVKKGRQLIIFIGLGILLFGCSAMLLGGIFYLAWLLWLPYCIALVGVAIIYPISMSVAIEKSPVGGAYPVALCGFIHQVMAAMIGAIASTLPSHYPWMTVVLILCLAVGGLTCAIYSDLVKNRID
ncbi:chloramphenicol transporter [Xenorhabdus beddingii]|uniref:Chloramphenicol transporter n=1 Tax=Xenorhabdus beddingii TaxID=40578 RepID=A0A1Y2SQX3_9GAMM|nr:MFS transporter [Xenorhabdus beddingii]OTA20522.1 chloramphenicol transporter [Xenorhabdus beddingii]